MILYSGWNWFYILQKCMTCDFQVCKLVTLPALTYTNTMSVSISNIKVNAFVLNQTGNINIFCLNSAKATWNTLIHFVGFPVAYGTTPDSTRFTERHSLCVSRLKLTLYSSCKFNFNLEALSTIKGIFFITVTKAVDIFNSTGLYSTLFVDTSFMLVECYC